MSTPVYKLRLVLSLIGIMATGCTTMYTRPGAGPDAPKEEVFLDGSSRFAEKAHSLKISPKEADALLAKWYNTRGSSLQLGPPHLIVGDYYVYSAGHIGFLAYSYDLGGIYVNGNSGEIQERDDPRRLGIDWLHVIIYTPVP